MLLLKKKSVVRGESMLLKKQKQSDRNHSKQNPHTYLCKKMRQTLTTHYTHTKYYTIQIRNCITYINNNNLWSLSKTTKKINMLKLRGFSLSVGINDKKVKLKFIKEQPG